MTTHDNINKIKSELEFHTRQLAQLKRLLSEFPSAPRTRSAINFHEQRIRSLRYHMRAMEEGVMKPQD